MASIPTQTRQTVQPYSASPDYTPSLGTNIEGLSYYSSAMPLLDLMKASSGFFAESATTFNTGDQLNLDANGYVTSIPTNADYDKVGIILLDNNAAATPLTDYVVLYQGEGTIHGMSGTTVVSSKPGELIVQSGADGSLQLQITSTDPNHTGDYIQNMHVVQESQLALYQAGLTFNPAFLAKVDNFSTIRTMELMDTNQIFDQSGNALLYDSSAADPTHNFESAPLLTWADRPTLDEATWSHGVPVEALVEAANLAGTDLWVNMPINASDDYIQQFAAYVKANLDPGLKVHVELSNEVWNFQFPQAYYAQAQAEKLYGSTNDWMEWYGMRAAQMGSIWKDAFGEPETGADTSGRVSVVVGAQLENPGLELQSLNAPVGTTGNIAADYFNEYAVTAYYGNFLTTDSATNESWVANSDYSDAITALSASVISYNTPLYQDAEAQATAYGLKLVSYESGFGAQTPTGISDSAAYTTFLENLQRNPAIYNIEQQNIAAFEAAGGSLYDNFDAVASPSVYGSWGALESVSDTTSPRYQALTDWNEAHAATTSEAVAYQNARIYQAGDGGEIIAGTLHGYDVLVGGAGNDTFVPYGTGAIMDGEGGVNTVMLPGALAGYTFVTAVDGSISVSGYGETFTAINIQHFVGSDGATSTGSPTSPSTSQAATSPAASRAVTSSPTVTSLVASGTGVTNGAGDLHAGAVLILTVNLTQAATVSGGLPMLTLNDGGVATYTGGSGSTALTFSYTVAAGQNTADLAVTAIQLNNATVVTTGGVAADLSGAVTNPAGVLQVDTTTPVAQAKALAIAAAPTVIAAAPSAPTLTSLVASGIGITAGAGDLHAGSVVTLTANLSQVVSVSGGTPTLLLNDGGVATYTGGSGSAALTFSYTVAAGQNTADLAVTAVQLNGATVGTGIPTIAAGSGQSLTDANGHVFSFGAVFGSDHIIMRDGVSDGFGVKLALINGTVWDDTASLGWYADQAGKFTYQTTAPSLGSGVAADLSGVVTNPAGVLQVDTNAVQAISGETLQGASIANTTLYDSGVVHVTGGTVSALNNVSINETGGTSPALSIDSGATLDLMNSTIQGGTFSNSGSLDSIVGTSVLRSVSGTNSGLISATSSTLIITSGSLTNNGSLIVDSGTLTLSEAVTGTGAAFIKGTNSVLEFGSSSNQSTTFSNGAIGTLKLDDASTYTGTITGLVSGDTVNLTNFQYSSNPIITGIVGTGAVGSTTNVTIQAGAQIATLHLLNQTPNEFANNSSAYLLKDDGTAHHGLFFGLA